MTSALADSATMLRRNLKHMLRYPSMIAFMILMPVGFLLLFVYILGGTVGPAGVARWADRSAQDVHEQQQERHRHEHHEKGH